MSRESIVLKYIRFITISPFELVILTYNKVTKPAFGEILGTHMENKFVKFFLWSATAAFFVLVVVLAFEGVQIVDEYIAKK
jgi:hypothetical protein